jgi:hypothetical protein
MTGITADRKTGGSVFYGTVQIADGIIRWNNVSTLPASVHLFSARGALVKRFDIRSAQGARVCAGLPAGVYVAMVGTGTFSCTSNKLVVSGR